MKFVQAFCFIILFSISEALAARSQRDSLVLETMFRHQEKMSMPHGEYTSEAYIKVQYQIPRRNFGLHLIPSMYTIANGPRNHITEELWKFYFKEGAAYKIQRQAHTSTIRNNRSAMMILNDFLTPSLHAVTIYRDHILSPFCRQNASYYRYKVMNNNKRLAIISFAPRYCENTLLLKGTARVDLKTGHVRETEYEGEFDMIKFKASIKSPLIQPEASHLLPLSCVTDFDFRFMGNHVKAKITVVHQPKIAPSRISNSNNDTRLLFDSIRPISLSKSEKLVYKEHKEAQDSVISNDTLQESRNALKEIGVDISNYLLASHMTESKDFYLKASPLIEPQYLTYSHQHGFSYKMAFTAELNTGKNSTLSLMPTLGYNFKIKQWFFNAPLRYTYNQEKDNYLELTWNNGNRISNSAVIDELKRQYGDDFVPKADDLDVFDDNKLRLNHHIRVTNWLSTEQGLIYHRRSAINKGSMQQYHKRDVYQSLAPSLGIIVQPWQNGPILTANYERGIKSNTFLLDYARIEGSASYMLQLPTTRSLSFRAGVGFYTHKANDYFMDYANFSENYLPGGWEDEWTGDFQLLDSHLYNTSDYYVSNNICFSSPILLSTMIPIVNRYVERERFYLNTLFIQHCRPYNEIGYAISTRFLSAGVFTNLYNLEIHQIGAKFTFELFHRW